MGNPDLTVRDYFRAETEVVEKREITDGEKDWGSNSDATGRSDVQGRRISRRCQQIEAPTSDSEKTTAEGQKSETTTEPKELVNSSRVSESRDRLRS
jgi:hypothetical protein